MSQTDAAVLLVDSLAGKYGGPVQVSDLKSPIYAISISSDAVDKLRERGAAGVFLLLRQLARDGVIEIVAGPHGGFRTTPEGKNLVALLEDEFPDAKTIAETARATIDDE